MRYSVFFCFKQKTAYEMRISDWSSDVCSSDLIWNSAPCNRYQAWRSASTDPAAAPETCSIALCTMLANIYSARKPIAIQRSSAGCVRSRASPRITIDILTAVNSVDRWMRTATSAGSKRTAASRAQERWEEEGDISGGAEQVK